MNIKTSQHSKTQSCQLSLFPTPFFTFLRQGTCLTCSCEPVARHHSYWSIMKANMVFITALLLHQAKCDRFFIAGTPEMRPLVQFYSSLPITGSKRGFKSNQVMRASRGGGIDDALLKKLKPFHEAFKVGGRPSITLPCYTSPSCMYNFYMP